MPLSTFFPFNVFWVDVLYQLTFCPCRRFLHSTLFPINVFYFSTFFYILGCSIWRFFTFRRFVQSMFFIFYVLSLSTFCLLGVLYFDVLSVNLHIPCLLELVKFWDFISDETDDTLFLAPDIPSSGLQTWERSLSDVSTFILQNLWFVYCSYFHSHESTKSKWLILQNSHFLNCCYILSSYTVHAVSINASTFILRYRQYIQGIKFSTNL